MKLIEKKYSPQSWLNCDYILKKYILDFVELLKDNLRNQLIGIYLHGSLAMGSYFSPKSDIDIIAIINNKLDIKKTKELNLLIANYSNLRPTIGDIEFSIITIKEAQNVSNNMTFELHYSESWKQKILNNEIIYGITQYDSDLPAHLMCIKKRGICLYGLEIDSILSDINWNIFLYSILEDYNWIIENDNICESPYYCILNLCRDADFHRKK